jgi:hypothetical protein
MNDEGLMATLTFAHRVAVTRRPARSFPGRVSDGKEPMQIFKILVLGLDLSGSFASQRAAGQRISIPVDRMRAPKDRTRIRAFYDLVKDANRLEHVSPSSESVSSLVKRAKIQDDLAQALISQLKYENEYLKSASPNAITELYGQVYVPDLVHAVTKLNDPRSLPVLLEVLSMGQDIRRTIAGFGEVSVVPLVGKLSDDAGTVRWSAAQTLGFMLEKRRDLGLSSGAMSKIRESLLWSLDRKDDFMLREVAIDALASVEDSDVRGAMEQLAQSDSYSVVRSNRTVFPIREKANAWLAAHRK